jgi:hypothetical protein
MVDLAHELIDGGEAGRLAAAQDVSGALEYLWPRLGELREVMPAS